MKTLTYDENLDLKLDLYEPESPESPLFVYMHGGGLTGGNRSSNADLFKKLQADGIAVASIEYRMYPTAKFPEFIEDCAKAIGFLKSYKKFTKYIIGGSSAGSYLAMMLMLNPDYLSKYEAKFDSATEKSGEKLDPLKIEGWLFDAGQPTTHFNVLHERGLDTRLVRIDEAAPLYYINKDFKPTREDGKLPKILSLSASNDMTCRLEQIKLFDATLRHFGYPTDRVRFEYMNGYGHCAYNHDEIFVNIINKFVAEC